MEVTCWEWLMIRTIESTSGLIALFGLIWVLNWIVNKSLTLTFKLWGAWPYAVEAAKRRITEGRYKEINRGESDENK
jgi:hypothetical protein